jgi:hypothetical protein
LEDVEDELEDDVDGGDGSGGSALEDVEDELEDDVDG